MYNQLPDLESLRCFVAAASCRSFREAAKRVHLSPSAFSERIQRLEDQLERPLFVRSTRHVSLSEEGVRLLQYATELLQQAQSFQQQAKQKETEISLTLGTRYELGLSYVLPLLEELQIIYPHIHIDLFFGDSPSLTNALLSSQIDVAFSSMRVDNPLLCMQTTHEEHYVLVGVPSLVQNIHSIADMYPHTLVDISSSFPLFRYFGEPNRLLAQNLFSKHHFLGTISALFYWILRQDALAVLPLYFVQPSIEKGELQVVLPQYQLQHDYFRIFWRQNHWAQRSILNISSFVQSHPLQ